MGAIDYDDAAVSIVFYLYILMTSGSIQSGQRREMIYSEKLYLFMLKNGILQKVVNL